MSLNIVIPIFPEVTQLDFTGPHQFFSRMPDAAVSVASPQGQDINADGLRFSDLKDLAEIEHCDLLCVPGGYGVSQMIHDKEFLSHITRLGEAARYVSSVCTGSIILAAAGLLNGKRAACHWAWRDLLGRFPEVQVGEERVIRDGNVFSGGGVTAGIDVALIVIAEVAGDKTAQAIQLALEYAPAPPFNSGDPRTAPPEVLEAVTNRIRAHNDREQQIEKFLEEQRLDRN